MYRAADNSLARPGRKQATTTKILILQTTQKKETNSEICPPNQVSEVAVTTASDEKSRPFNCFFSRVRLRTYLQPCK